MRNVFSEEKIKRGLLDSFKNEIICLRDSIKTDGWVGDDGGTIRFRHFVDSGYRIDEENLFKKAIEDISETIIIEIYTVLLDSVDSQSIISFNDMDELIKYIEPYRENITFSRYKEINSNSNHIELPEYFLFGFNCLCLENQYKNVDMRTLESQLYKKYKPYDNHKSTEIDNMLFIHYQGWLSCKNRHSPAENRLLFLIKNNKSILYDIKIRSIKMEYHVYTSSYEINFNLIYNKGYSSEKILAI